MKRELTEATSIDLVPGQVAFVFTSGKTKNSENSLVIVTHPDMKDEDQTPLEASMVVSLFGKTPECQLMYDIVKKFTFEKLRELETETINVPAFLK